MTRQQQIILQQQLKTIIISDRSELDEVYKMLQLLYSKEYKIVKYSPTLETEAANDIKKFLEFTVKLFSSCKIFITLSHTEESANIIFMNPTSIVIEVRSAMGSNNGWHPSYFASAVGVNYTPSYSPLLSSSSSSSNRHRSKNVSVDMNNVLSIVSSFLHSTSYISTSAADMNINNNNNNAVLIQSDNSAEISSLQKENNKLKEQILNLLQQKL